MAALPVTGDNWPPYEHVNVQLALDAWLAQPGRDHRLVGITGFQHRMFSLADLAQPETARHGPGVGSVALESLPSGPGGQTTSCVRCGLYLVTEADAKLAILFREELQHGRRGRPGITIEVLSANTDRAAAILAELRTLTLQLNVFRGHVVSFAQEMFGPGGAPSRFVDRPELPRSGLVLPDGTLELVERHALGVAAHRDRVRASGQHLKRGLLYAPPGTGRTHTVRYLLSRWTGTAVILSGQALQMGRRGLLTS